MTDTPHREESSSERPLIAVCWTVIVVLAGIEFVSGFAAGHVGWRMLHGVLTARLALVGGRASLAVAVAVAITAECIAINTLPDEDFFRRLLQLPFHAALLVVIATLGRMAFRRGEQARAAVRHDAATGLLNGLGFRERVQLESSRLVRIGQAFSLVVFDGNRFKRLNDRHGHVEGDRCLQRVAALLREGTRPYDAVGRLGGDEFALLLPETDAEAALTVTARLLSVIDAEMQASGWPVTFSAGIATFPNPPLSVDAAIAAADALMYEAKRGGETPHVRSRTFAAPATAGDSA